MNRDWFARTQPETDGKLELLRRYPPVLFIDAHEMGNSAGYFFPPNADPVYHEIAARRPGLDQRPLRRRDAGRVRLARHPVLQLRRLRPLRRLRRHGPRQRLRRRRMTFEKTSSPTDVRVEQYLAIGPPHQAAAQARSCATGTAGSRPPPGRGGAGAEPVYGQGTGSGAFPTSRCATTSSGRRPARPAPRRRLQRMDVEVRRLTAPLRSATTRPTAARGRPRCHAAPSGADGAAPEALGAGDAARGHPRRSATRTTSRLERTAVMNSPAVARASGAPRSSALRCRTRRPARRPPTSRRWPVLSPQVGGHRVVGWLRWLLDQWGSIPRRDRRDIATGGLAGADVLLVPDGYASRTGGPVGPVRLGPRSEGPRRWSMGPRGALRRLERRCPLPRRSASVGAVHARRGGGFFTPGSLFRIAADEEARWPTARGFAWAMHLGGYVMRSPIRRGACATRRPATDFFMSGEADGEAALGGTAAVSTSAWARPGSSRSASSRTSARSPTARSASSTTRCSADPAGAATARVAVRRRAASTARRLRVVREPLRIVVRPRGAGWCEGC